MRRTLGILLFCIIGLVVLWRWMYPTYTHRYRLTFAIETDGAVHSGSSVIEVSWVGQPKLGDAPPFLPRVRGQAPLIDLGARGVVVAALHPDGVDGLFANADILAIRAFEIDGRFDSYRLITEQTGRRDLSPDNMPLLIWIPDPFDPRTARPTTVDHIPDLFGPTARLSAAYVEITRDPVTIDIDRKLPWYAQMAAEQKRGVITHSGTFQLFYNMLVGADS
jgi:hypothetical protein